jgi:hypothetical protein
LQAFAAFGYVVATGVTRADATTLRTAIAAVGCLLIPFVTLWVSSPLLFAVGENSNGNDPATSIVFGVLALPTAAFQVLVTRRRIAVSILEFLSHPCTMGGAFLVSLVLSQRLGERIFDGWPILLALTPFVALAIVGATVVPLWRLASACLLAAIPIYFGMTILDIKDGRGAEAALWPVRVWSDFISINDHLALAQAVTLIRPGVAARIGEYWYRFERPRMQIAWPPPSRVRRPDRITFLQLDIPADDLDLPEMRITGDYVDIGIETALMFDNTWRSPEELERGGTFVAIADRDLVVYIAAPHNRDIDRADVRTKLRRFIENARVDPTAPVPSSNTP